MYFKYNWLTLSRTSLSRESSRYELNRINFPRHCNESEVFSQSDATIPFHSRPMVSVMEEVTWGWTANGIVSFWPSSSQRQDKHRTWRSCKNQSKLWKVQSSFVNVHGSCVSNYVLSKLLFYYGRLDTSWVKQVYSNVQCTMIYSEWFIMQGLNSEWFNASYPTY